MSKQLKLALSLFMALTPVVLQAATYEVNVKRIDKDMYRTQEGFFIETRYCYEYVYFEDAILKYDRYSYDNKIYFRNGQSCDVKGVYRPD